MLKPNTWKPQDVRILQNEAEKIEDEQSDESGSSMPEQKSDSEYPDSPSEDLNFDW